jgi:aspartate racemase
VETAEPGRARHIGIAAVTAEGASLCYRTICSEGPALLGPFGHPEVTIHSFPLSKVLHPAFAGRWEEVGRLLLASAEILARSGAAFAICPDNTAHQGLDLVRGESPLPWLHIGEAVAEVAAERGYRRVGVLGTRWLMEGPVYPRVFGERGIGHLIPGEADRQRIDDLIFGELVPGRFEKQTLEYFLEVIEEMGRQGCDAVALGCTEIPLLVRESDSPLPALDSTRILARAALRESVRGLTG